MFIFSDELTTSRIGNLTRIILTLLAIGVTIHVPVMFEFRKPCFFLFLV